ncbi:MAG: hypothetical protein GY714_00140 [Desulfobacterales bacterium]|nr:hypothetical protein [Desulfobacterales bacterium]MCP4160002.1 hypothetical protein [Deltaproteobacteria bacterium]
MTEENGINKESDVSDVILNPVSIDMEHLFVKPEKNDTTKIAALISKCIVPFSIGIVDVPEKILAKVEEAGKDAEMILPVEAIEVYKIVLKLKYRLFGDDQKGSDDSTDIFTYDAVSQAGYYINEFKQIVQEFCKEVESVQSQVASEKSFYMAQTLGTEVAIDSSMILTASQNMIQRLNVLASGLNGYKILALVKVINEIGALLDHSVIKKFYEAPNRTSIVNKLGYRIKPSDIALNNQLNEILDIVLELKDSSEIEKEVLVKLFSLSALISKGLVNI